MVDKPPEMGRDDLGGVPDGVATSVEFAEDVDEEVVERSDSKGGRERTDTGGEKRRVRGRSRGESESIRAT
jgi:hypothetical protein